MSFERSASAVRDHRHSQIVARPQNLADLRRAFRPDDRVRRKRGRVRFAATVLFAYRSGDTETHSKLALQRFDCLPHARRRCPTDGIARVVGVRAHGAMLSELVRRRTCPSRSAALRARSSTLRPRRDRSASTSAAPAPAASPAQTRSTIASFA